MKTATTKWDTYQNQAVTEYTIENKNGVKLGILSWGATLHTLSVPSKDGDKNLVLSYHKMEDYLSNPFYVCMGIGRIGGRLGGGTFEMGGKTYTVDTNEGKDTTLHGGPHGFNTVNWDGEIDDSDANEAKIILSHTFKSSDDSFPGDMTAKMIYSLDNNDRVNLKFEANSTALTLFNPTLHVYFNLSDDQLISGQTLQINAKEHLEVTSEKIPTGNFIQNAGTPFDFSKGQNLGEAIRGMQGTTEKGFDDLFHVEPAADNKIAELSDPQSNRSVTIKSSRNGLVVFTANSFTSDMKLATGAGQPYMGVALEAQTLSDTPHHPNFGDVSVPAGKTQTYEIAYEVKY
ncbi:aldose epimerase family protein [Levilactobacillus tujiorum]|uniref:Maltose epimerase n=1 Tax=Levilactobacillus tujiorum TaxID=2912243 RepID=A0ABX1L5U5_9LACO|nr:aldose epimerase family protein [Levilactobacillus tujiorum]MCH5464924.1 galactose mutarotase [Levilactobacillus tujiorum]NLR12463.1 galactose mutarotase [Lactobacillus sp. HBUAS51387]NLR30430.1 galactose mutarotase [Levilactobacillus tujiorum]NLR32365.1 galactose mutarotase [Levilactobacillus tujiorum]